MRWLADENLARPIVNWLRSEGHDVSYVAELTKAIPDEEVLRQAEAEDRFLLTSDKDFGDMIYHQHLLSRGIVLIRIPSQSTEARLDRLKAVWTQVEANVAGNMVVVTAQRVRVRPLSA